MNFKTLKQAFVRLSLTFALASAPPLAADAIAARNTEPYSCKINGRTYNPQPAAITVNTQTGHILSGKNIDEARYPASLTKIMTLALIFDALQEGKLKLDDQITMHHSKAVLATKRESRSAWLKEGTQITVEEAIQAIAVASANNISVLMAEHLAGNEEDFVLLMNTRARSLGMNNTTFTNASGLPDKRQITTARDMAKLAIHIHKEHPQYYHFFSQPEAEFGPYRANRSRRNHNELVVKNENIDGIKTGYTCDSGYNIVISATGEQARVVGVVFGSRTPYQRNVKAKNMVESALDLVMIDSSNTTAHGIATKPNVYDDSKIQIVLRPKDPFYSPKTLTP